MCSHRLFSFVKVYFSVRFPSQFSCFINNFVAPSSFLYISRVSFPITRGEPQPLGIPKLHRARSREHLHQWEQHSDPRNTLPVHTRLQRPSSRRSSVCHGNSDSPVAALYTTYAVKNLNLFCFTDINTVVQQAKINYFCCCILSN